MAQPIDDENGARRLARAIVSDIKLYDGAELARGASPAEAIAEGRELFGARVAPRWHDLFEEELAKLAPAACQLAVPPEAAPSFPERGASETQTTSAMVTPPSPRPTGRSRASLIFAVLAALAAAAFVLWQLR